MHRNPLFGNIPINLALQVVREPETTRCAAYWQATNGGHPEAAAVLRLTMPYGPLRPLSEVNATGTTCLIQAATDLAAASYRAYWQDERAIEVDDFPQGSQAGILLLLLCDDPFELELVEVGCTEEPAATEPCGPPPRSRIRSRSRERQRRARAAADFPGSCTGRA